jgi:predicted nucleic acid-binding protein
MKLFVDTSAWFALNSSTDQNHAAAIEFIKTFQRHAVILYTTDYIVDETVTLIRVKVSHKQAINFLNSALRSKNVIRSQVSRDLIMRAEQIFRKYSDKLWSYTDCVSFAFMDAQGLSDAFAFDQNFSQYGKSVHP